MRRLGDGRPDRWRQLDRGHGRDNDDPGSRIGIRYRSPPDNHTVIDRMLFVLFMLFFLAVRTERSHLHGPRANQ